MQVQILAAAFLFFLVAATFVGLMDNRAATQGVAQLSAAAEMSMRAQEIGRLAQTALGEQPGSAFVELGMRRSPTCAMVIPRHRLAASSVCSTGS